MRALGIALFNLIPQTRRTKVNWHFPKDFALEVFLRIQESELDENQKKFLRAIAGNNVVMRIKKSKKKDTRFENLLSLLRKMNKNGFITALGVIET